MIAGAPRTNVHVRIADSDDLPRILELRAAHERDFVGRVNIPLNAQWMVAEDAAGRIRGCAGFAIATAVGHERTVIATDFYDDGTPTGKRALLALLRDGIRADVGLFTVVPLDRIPLVQALEKRGLVATGICMEKRHG